MSGKILKRVHSTIAFGRLARGPSLRVSLIMVQPHGFGEKSALAKSQALCNFELHAHART